jgi:hypothetical protein
MVTRQQIDLDKIKIQLATTAWDVDDIKEVLSNYHPLSCNRAKGRRMYYMATYKGEWVAVLVFDAAVRANKMREGQIGWSAAQRDTRLQHVANNSRFLVSRAFQGTPNVASKILALIAERISKDWMRRYGIPLLALETYVDPQHNNNDGTCYIAAGWNRLGLSTGYQAAGKERTHGKWYFLKALHPQSYEALRSPIPHALMTGVKEVSGSSNNNFVLDASKFDIKSLQKALSAIEDPRTKHGIRYKFLPLLSMCVAAAVSGHTQYRQIADWIRAIPAPERASFGLRGDSTPNETTIGNFLRTINPEQLNKALTGWITETYPHQANGYQRIILDGKALRATASKTSDQVGFLNVFAADLGIVIEQLPCLKGAGEKIAAQQFVDSHTEAELKGKVILADAIHTDSQLISRLEKKRLSISSLSKIITQS